MTDIEKLGVIGENIVAETFESLGLQVVLSENKYDSVKDMLIEGQTAEVKTFTLIKKNKSFCMEPNQWRKLDNVERLFFVEIPDYPQPINVYESVTKKYFTDSFSNGIIKRFYPKADMRKVRVIDDQDLAATMRNLTHSDYIKRGPNDRRARFCNSPS
jgi:hypothetical protein